MTLASVEGLRADREDLLAICKGLTPEQWAAPSGCEGWTVKDVVTHMGALFALVIDPSSLPDTTGLGTERAQDVYVEARRDWTPERVLAEYETQSEQAIELLSGLEGNTTELPLGDLGTYPLWVLPSAYAFDHFTHIRADLHEPRGPLAAPAPPADEQRLAPALDWVEAAVAQHNPEVVPKLPGAVEFRITGEAARTLRVGEGDVVATVEGEGEPFVRAITHRASWEAAGLRAEGDQPALDLARRLKVF